MRLKFSYQTRILGTAREKNTLVCLPTGLGKTNIAIMLAAERLQQFPASQILVLAPTRPLASQHAQTFRKFMPLEGEEFQVVTGQSRPRERVKMYGKKLLFATPQTIQKDLEKGRLSLENVSLLVIDEIHHAVGKYAYPSIAQRFVKEGMNPRILGLTASPGSSREKIKGICRNACIEAVEIATESDEDVRPYVKGNEVEWIEVCLPESFAAIQSLLGEAYSRRTKKLGVKTRKELLWLQSKLQDSIHAGNRTAFGIASLVAQAIKIEHASTLLETQSIPLLRSYFRKLQEDPSKAAASLRTDREFSRAMGLAEGLFGQGSRHPKISRLCTLVEAQFREQPGSRIIVFANYREMARELRDILAALGGCRPVVLLGQREGVSQKGKLATIRKYQEGEFNCLVTTSVGEEGLHLEEADRAIFYEAVPSEIRQIQRRGRVGRTRMGKVSILVTKGTRDEAFKWAAFHKERKMRKALRGMQMKEDLYKQLDIYTQG